MSQAAATHPTANGVEASRWPRGLLLLTVALAIAAPLAMYSGRIPGLGESDYLIYYRLLFYNDFTNSLAMLAAFLVALALRPLRESITHAADWMSKHAWQTCVIAFIALAIAARVVYQGFPLAMDEYAPLLQARIFAQGDLAITYPRELLDRMVVPGFQGYFILVNHETGQAASAYWPGLALLMTPFALFRGEWLLNPLLGTAGLWLIGDLAKQASGQEQTRGWAMLAALACPQYTINALSFYAMPALLTLNLLFLWLLLRPGWKPAVGAGLVGSIALVLHNPVPHALFALPVGIWMLLDGERRRRLVPVAIGYLPLTVSLLFGWMSLTHQMGLRETAPALGNAGLIHQLLGELQELLVVPGVELFRTRAYALWKVLIWAAPGVVLIACITRPRNAAHRILLGSFLLTFAFYFFIPFDQGHGWGYRYLHSAWALIPITVAVFAVGGAAQKELVAAGLFSGLLATTAFLWTTHATISKSIASQPPVSSDGQSFVFIANRPGLYTVDLIRNYPSDRGRIVRMLGTGITEDRKLIAEIAPGAKLVSGDERGATWVVAEKPKTPPP